MEIEKNEFFCAWTHLHPRSHTIPIKSMIYFQQQRLQPGQIMRNVQKAKYQIESLKNITACILLLYARICSVWLNKLLYYDEYVHILKQQHTKNRFFGANAK